MTQALLFERVAPAPVLTFDFYGLPAPKGSKSAVMIDGRPVLIEGSSTKYRRELKLWQEAVEGMLAVTYRGEPIDEPIEVTIEFHMPVVEGDPYRDRHTVKPDIDKLCRALLDSFTKAGVWRDDSRVFHLHAMKRYVCAGEEPGACVTVVCRGEDELVARSQRKVSPRR